jgi:hypothetical protein
MAPTRAGPTSNEHGVAPATGQGPHDRKLTDSLVVDAVLRDHCDAWHNVGV